MTPARIMTFFLLLAGTACLFPLNLSANVRNDGDDAVLIEFYRPGLAPRKETLYPGQNIVMPDNTKMVKVVQPYSAGRGDENIVVTVSEPNGLTGVITKYGDSYELNKTEEFDTGLITYQPGKVTNRSNIVIKVDTKTGRRMLPARVLYVEESMILASDIKEVTIGATRPMRGDETIAVEVLMPDQQTYNVTGINTTLRVAENESSGSGTTESEGSEGAGSGSLGPQTFVSSNSSPSQAVSATGASAKTATAKGGTGTLVQRQGTFKGGSSGSSTGDKSSPDAETSLTFVENQAR